MDVWIGIVKEVGFPIAVAAFVLIRLNGKMDRLIDALGGLTALLKETTQALRHQQRTLERIEELERRRPL